MVAILLLLALAAALYFGLAAGLAERAMRLWEEQDDAETGAFQLA